MYSKLPLKHIGITENFGMRKDPISGVSTYHYGTDFGFNKYQGEPVYAANTGKVVYEGYDSNLGNYVVLKYQEGNNTIINRYLHLKNKALVKTNSNVKRGQLIGYMGNTGYVTGTHLHFEYWVCPKNYTYNYADRPKYAKNPLNYCYLFEDQTVSQNSSSKVKRVVGTPVSRNTSKNQIRVTGKGLNCRNQPSLNGKVLGFIDLGYYNILDTKISNGYTWYKIANNKWVAYLSSIVTRYLLPEKATNEFQNITQEETTNQTITNEIINSSNITEDENNEENQTEKVENLNKFTSNKDDYYYIYLKKGETLYYPK